MQKRKGFTLIELVIVIIIIGILSIIAVPMYRGYVRRARASEGRALVGAVAAAQRVYYAERSSYRAIAATSFDSVIDVDVRNNKFFTTFVSVGTSDLTVSAVGAGEAAGMSVVLLQSPTTAATISSYGE